MGMMFRTRYIFCLVPSNWNLVTKNKNSKKHNAPNMLQTSVKALISGLSGLGMCCAILHGFGSIAYSGDLDSPAAPSDSGSAMYSYGDLYDRLSTGAAGSKRTGGFTEPSSTPASTGQTMDDLMSVAPAKDNSNGAGAADVVSGHKYWGLTGGNWGEQSDGTIISIGQQNITPGTTSQTVSQGFHNGTGTIAGDSNLVSDKIKSGVTMFGVQGSPYVVNTGSGDATASDIISGKKAWINGVEVTGTATTGGDPTCNGTLNGTRWCDNGDGTVLDMTTGLIWLQNANCSGYFLDWTTAISKPITDLKSGLCGLFDASVLGDWRLPTEIELSVLANGTEAVRYSTPRAFADVPIGNFWSSTTDGSTPAYARNVYLINGTVSNGNKTSALYVLPVRVKTCNSSNLDLCTTSSVCTGAGLYWWSDNRCLGVPESETVTSAGGKVWMDRNLGASQVATSSTDSLAYGDLYQWGRGADGHEKRTSATTSTNSSTDVPGHGDLITESSSPYDWRVPQNHNLWQGGEGTNNPCPAGFRLPTYTELNTELTSWSSSDSAGAFASPLKLVRAGYRSYYYLGDLSSVGSMGTYWSSSVNNLNSFSLIFFSSSANMSGGARADGFSVRCLED